MSEKKELIPTGGGTNIIKANPQLPGALNLSPMTLQEKEKALYTLMDKYIAELPAQAAKAQELAPRMYLEYEFFGKSISEAGSITARRIQNIKDRYQKYCDTMSSSLREGVLHTLFFLFFRSQMGREYVASDIINTSSERQKQSLEEFIQKYGTSELVYMAPNKFEQFDLVKVASEFTMRGQSATNEIFAFFSKISKVQNSIYRESISGNNDRNMPKEKTIISPRGNPIVTFLDDSLSRHFEILGPVSQTKGFPITNEFHEWVDVKKANIANKLISPDLLNPLKNIIRDMLIGKLGMLTSSAKDLVRNFARNVDRPIVLDNKTAQEKLYYDIKYHNPRVELNEFFATHGDFWNHLLGIATIERGMPTIPRCHFIISVDKDYSLLYHPNSQEIYTTNEHNCHNTPYGFIVFNHITEKEFAKYQTI